MNLSLKVNRRSYSLKVAPEERLLDVLRDYLGLTGTKEGCGEGECGACTILLEGRPVNACLVLAGQAQGCEITTIEGIGTWQNPHPIQRAFVEEGAVQCGYCTPGMVLATKALLDKNPKPNQAEVALALSGNLCRCTGYDKIFRAVQRAAEGVDK